METDRLRAEAQVIADRVQRPMILLRLTRAQTRRRARSCGPNAGAIVVMDAAYTSNPTYIIATIHPTTTASTEK